MLTAAKKKSSQCICISAWEILWLTLCGCVCSWRCVCKPVCVCCPHPIWTQRWFFLLQFMVKTLKNIYFKKTYAVKHVPLNFQINILLDISYEISNLAMNFCFGNEKKKTQNKPKIFTGKCSQHRKRWGHSDLLQEFLLFLPPLLEATCRLWFFCSVSSTDAGVFVRRLPALQVLVMQADRWCEPYLHNIWKLSVPLRKLEGLLS